MAHCPLPLAQIKIIYAVENPQLVSINTLSSGVWISHPGFQFRVRLDSAEAPIWHRSLHSPELYCCSKADLKKYFILSICICQIQISNCDLVAGSLVRVSAAARGLHSEKGFDGRSAKKQSGRRPLCFTSFSSCPIQQPFLWCFSF